MIAQRNASDETGWKESIRMSWKVSLLIAIMGICVLPMAQARPTRTQTPKDVKEKDSRQRLETLLSDFNGQKARLKAQLARLQQHYGQRKGRQEIVYVVKPGDTLATMARKFYGRDIKLKEAVAAIRQANPDVTENRIRPGQTLRIPVHPASKRHTPNPGSAQPDRDWEEELDHWLEQMQAWSDELTRTVEELNIEDRLQKTHNWKQGLLNHEAINQWQQDLNAWQESAAFRNWQQDIQDWGQKVESFVRGKKGDRPDPNHAPAALPAMPTLPRLPAPPRAGVPEGKPPERHRFEVVKEQDVTSPVNVGININNPHGSITLRGHKDGATRMAISLLVGGCSRAEAERIIKPTIEAMASQDSQKVLQVTVELLQGVPLQNLCVDIEVSLPACVPVEARTNMGAIGLEDLSADAEAQTNMGVITVRNVTGATECRSNMGTICFITSKDPSIEITASTNLGSLHTDLSLGKASDPNRVLHGKLGSGGQRVDLRTNMGAIYIGTAAFVERQRDQDKSKQKQKDETPIQPRTPAPAGGTVQTGLECRPFFLNRKEGTLV